MNNGIIMPLQKRVWAEINIDNLVHNYNSVVDKLDPRTKICCVVKANAYGHGAVRLAHEYERLGADFLAVASIDEALQLRNNNITLPILILGYTDPKCANLLGQYNITQCAFSYDYAKRLNESAGNYNVSVKVHIKVDTGMGRLGFQCIESDLIKAVGLNEMENLIVEGVFTHFSSADEGASGVDYTRMQLKRFNDAVFFFERRGLNFKFKHCSNSSAALDYPEATFDMVRLGIVLYGCQASEIINKCDLKPVMSLKSVISHIKNVSSEAFISYGRKGKTSSKARIATVPIGYADGLWRSNYDNALKVYVKEHSVSIIGKICMDQCMLDISGFDDIEVGDEVLIFGEENGHTVDDVAKLNNTISYEILCSVGARVPRIYKY